MSEVPKKPTGFSGLSKLSKLSGLSKESKEDEKKPKKTSGMMNLTKKFPSVKGIGEVTSSLGNELLVKDSVGITLDLVFKELSNLSDGALSDLRTFQKIFNSGSNTMVDSTLGMKLSNKNQWKSFEQTIKDINTILENVGKNEAHRFSLSQKNEGVIEMEEEEIREDDQNIVDDCESINVVEGEVNKENSIDMTQNNRILFLNKLNENQKKYITGYETYASDNKNAGIKGNPSLWDKWDDEHIYKLIEKGATVTWIGPENGKLGNQTLIWNKDKLGALRYVLDKKMFSFHQVYIPKQIAVLEDLRKLQKDIEKGLDEKDMNKLMEKHKKYNGIMIEEVDDDDKEMPDDDPRKILKDMFPKNPSGRYVETSILETDPMMSLTQIGTGIQKFLKTGGFGELYLGVEPIEGIMKQVIGQENYILIIGSVVLIELPSEIELGGESLKIITKKGEKIDDKVKEQLESMRTGKIHYYTKKGNKGMFELVRGIYMDRVGNFKISQIVVDVKIGDEKDYYSQIATAKQLAKRNLLTSVFPLFSSVSEKDKEKYMQSVSDTRAITDTKEKYNMIINAFSKLQEIQTRNKIEVLKRDKIKNKEPELYLEYDSKKKPDIEEIGEVNEENIEQIVQEEMKQTRDEIRKDREKQKDKEKRMEEEQKEGETK